MTVPRRLKFGLAVLVALVGSSLFAAPALADTQPDPQLSNVPYLAWRGEEVRLVKCDPDILGGLDLQQRQAIAAQSARFNMTLVDFLLVDWSGDPLLTQPQLEPGTVSMFFRSWDAAPCVAGTWVSQKAGLAQIKLVATINFSQANNFPSSIPEVISIKHDFNVGWMNINQANLSVVSGGTTDVAGSTVNQLQVLVNGTIPLLANYGELGLGTSITMPNDWARLANAMATVQDPLDPSPASHWDIHDEFSPTSSPTNPPDQHGAQSSCTHNTTAFFDNVDNCTGEPFDIGFGAVPEIGAFGRVWQGFTLPTIGPFDPQRPFQTLLSNGVLDSGDAPMPSARVDFAIAPNSGAVGDISGVGFLSEVDKHVVYSRDGKGTGTAHNLYGPFYAAWIPAAMPSAISAFLGPQGFPVFVPEASGTTGAFQPVGLECGRGNNFNGYLANCLYHYWDFAAVLRSATRKATGCLPLVAGGEAPNFNGAFTPSGDQAVVVYTDEHGEGRVDFNAGVGFFFTNLPGVGINANGGCDIANIPGGVLGTANVSATVRYPGEPTTARPLVSNTITKTVVSAFQKSITCYPKGVQPDEQNAAICVARALDITGAPFVGETVCFLADFNAEDIQWFTGAIPGTSITIGVTSRNAAAEGSGLRRICPRTDANGRAAVEIFNSNPTSVNVTALFVDEGIVRSIHVSFPITGQQGPATGVRTQPTSNNSTPNGQNSGPSSGPSSGPASDASDSQLGHDASEYRIVSGKLFRPLKRPAYMRVRVNGPTSAVRIRLTFASAKGKRLQQQLTSVETGKVVTIRGFKIPKATRAIRLSVAF